MHTLITNQVLQWAPFEDNNSVFERIVYVSLDSDNMYVINLNADDFPFIRLVDDVSTAMQTKEVRIVEYTTEAERMSYDCLPDTWKEELDKSWNALKENVDNEPYIFISEYRGQMVNECMEKSSYSMPKVHRLLKKYWKGGKIKIGLINRYDNCGKRGSNKLAK
jgi:putative transposase